MQKQTHIAVIDIGKTNAKLVLVDAATGVEKAMLKMANLVCQAPPYPHYDVEAIFAFLAKGLGDFAAQFGFEAISITTHGAAAALLDAQGQLVLPVLDYEYAYPAEIIAAYNAIRPDFAESFSPPLPQGLNLGAQLHFLKFTFPADFQRIAHIVTYPQYWAFRLTGVYACDVTSLGCHTDLWCPAEKRFSSLVDRLDIGHVLAPIRSCFDILGPVQPSLVTALHLPKAVPVYCGIHDSNASLLPHILKHEPPFSVLSTGTWMIGFAMGAPVPDGKSAEICQRDILCNVDAFGRPVPSARYMGGRLFESLNAGGPQASHAEIAAAMADFSAKDAQEIAALLPKCDDWPALQRAFHHFASDPSRYAGAITLFLAFKAADLLHILGAEGPILVEGPLAASAGFLDGLVQCAKRSVWVSEEAHHSGTAEGAALLSGIAPFQNRIRVVEHAAVD